MDPAVLQALLYESESSTLDFKREQYPFVGATDEQKSELLKDLLAFANAWRRSEAYILVGVEEAPGVAQVVGVTSHPDDAQLQQFVNSKTSRPLSFSYEVGVISGREIGIYRIPVQPRPVFLKRDFARLERDKVVLRRGSSTSIADPDEIARMGSVDASTDRPTPQLELTWTQPSTGQSLGMATAIKSNVLKKLPPHALPRVVRSTYSVDFKNADYYVEMVDYVQQQRLLTPLLLSVTNRSSVSADDVVVEIVVTRDGELCLFDKTQLIERPRYEGLTTIHEALAKKAAPPPDIQVQRLLNQWKLTVSLGRVRPQATVTTRDAVYLGALASRELQLEAVVFGHDLEPTRIALAVSIQVEASEMALSTLEPFIKEDVRG